MFWDISERHAPPNHVQKNVFRNLEKFRKKNEFRKMSSRISKNFEKKIPNFEKKILPEFRKMSSRNFVPKDF